MLEIFFFLLRFSFLTKVRGQYQISPHPWMNVCDTAEVTPPFCFESVQMRSFPPWFSCRCRWGPYRSHHGPFWTLSLALWSDPGSLYPLGGYLSSACHSLDNKDITHQDIRLFVSLYTTNGTMYMKVSLKRFTLCYHGWRNLTSV